MLENKIGLKFVISDWNYVKIIQYIYVTLSMLLIVERRRHVETTFTTLVLKRWDTESGIRAQKYYTNVCIISDVPILVKVNEVKLLHFLLKL